MRKRTLARDRPVSVSPLLVPDRSTMTDSRVRLQAVAAGWQFRENHQLPLGSADAIADCSADAHAFGVHRLKRPYSPHFLDFPRRIGYTLSDQGGIRQVDRSQG